MKYTFQYYLDIKTSASSLTMLQIQAGGEYLMQRTKHLFPAFKYMKMGRVSVKLLPASTLPVDPLGLSYAADDNNTIDPRDQMNPGLVRITNGEDILSDFTGLSDEQQQQVYTNTMLDPRWSKFMLQSGFKRSAVPLYWNVGQLHQDVYPGHIVNVPSVVAAPEGTPYPIRDTNTIEMYASNGVDAGGTGMPIRALADRSDPRGLFQVGHRGRMGWIPTDALVDTWIPDGSLHSQPMINTMPSINVITVLLPKAFKTLYYYRLFVTETVYLSGVKNTGVGSPTDPSVEYRAVDNFLKVVGPTPLAPSTASATGMNTLPAKKNDGGSDIHE